MARVNVYLPDDLAERAKLAGISLSKVTQDALRVALAEVESDAWVDRLERHDGAEVEHDRVLAALDAAREDFGAHSAR